MARWGVWAASAIGAAGAGAALALARRRRPAEQPARTRVDQFGVAEPDEPAPGGPAPEDPQEALDAARERLRARADALRDQIERDGEDPPPGA